jgi:leader peptidase (prepilin peptidase)/N-methyltransferase
MTYLFTQLPPAATLAIFAVAGACVGRTIVWYAARIFTSAAGSQENTPLQPLRRAALIDCVPILWSLLRGKNSGRLTRTQSLGIEVGTAVLFATFVVAVVSVGCQQIEQVTPSETWRNGRIVYHLLLMSLLIAASVTDFVDYVIPDEITIAGIIIGVAGAVLSGDLQMVHLWIDWNDVDPVIDGHFLHHGAYIPTWIKDHYYFHGLAWSTAGLVAGAGTMWLLRIISSLLLGRETLGPGDVTLMAMIGSFIGWQPVCFVFLLAPVCGVVVGLGVKIVSGRTFIAFGPYLCLSAAIVLFSWRWLWTPTRAIFGHPPSLALLAGVAAGGLILLLGLLRAYHAIPVEGRRRGDDAAG